MKCNLFTRMLVQARKEKKLTQTEACKIIGISEFATLSNWERGVSVPTVKMVADIVQAYDNPMIGYVYLSECTALGKMLLPKIREEPSNSIKDQAIWLQKEHNDITREMVSLINVVADGKIEEDEKEEYGRVVKEITDFAEVSIPLIVIKNYEEMKKPLQGGNLERAFG